MFEELQKEKAARPDGISVFTLTRLPSCSFTRCSLAAFLEKKEEEGASTGFKTWHLPSQNSPPSRTRVCKTNTLRALRSPHVDSLCKHAPAEVLAVRKAQRSARRAPAANSLLFNLTGARRVYKPYESDFLRDARPNYLANVFKKRREEKGGGGKRTKDA